MEEFSILNNNNVKLYNDDCFNVIGNLENINLYVCDPPYGIGLKNGYSDTNQNWDKMSNDEYEKFIVKWLNTIYDTMTENGTVWFFWGRTKVEQVLRAIKQTKFKNNYDNWLTYARGKGRGAKNRLKSLAEECFHLTKSNDYVWNSEEYIRRVICPYVKDGKKRGWTYNDNGEEVRFTGVGNVIPIFTNLEKDPGGDNRRGTVIDIGTGERLPLSGDIYNLQFPIVPSVLNTMEKQVHTAQKSVLILSMLTMISSNQGDTVVDCFGGSFSSGVAAAVCGRNYIGIEKDPVTYETGKNHLLNTDYGKWENYISSHIVSAEKNFKFGFDGNKIKQKILKKE